jgi:hypothetical protein
MKSKLIYLAFFSFVTVTLLIYVFGQMNLEMLIVPSYVLTWISSAVAPIAALFMLSRWRIREMSKRLTIFSLFLGYFLWLIAEIIWALNVFVFEVEPYPSVADGLWIVGYCLMSVSFFSIMKWTKYAERPKLRILNGLVSFGLAIFVLYSVILPLLIGAESCSLEVVVNLVYPILDVILFSLVFGSFLAMVGTDLWSSWAPIVLGSIIRYLGDIGFALLVMSDAYFDGHIIEVFWIIGDMGVAVGCFQMGLRAFDFREFLEFKTPILSGAPSEGKPFSEKLGLDVKGKIVLLEFDPESHYEMLVEWFMAEFSPTIVFTHKKNGLYELAKEMNQKLVTFSEQVSSPKRISETEAVLPARETSLMLSALNEALKANRNGELNIVFDSLSDLILLSGFEKTYSFLKYALEMLSPCRVTALFLLNSGAHDMKVTSNIRSLFTVQVIYGKDGLRVARAIQS